jgi:hypothetical protein
VKFYQTQLMPNAFKIQRSKLKSAGVTVTLLAWIAQRLAASKNVTRNASDA